MFQLKNITDIVNGFVHSTQSLLITKQMLVTENQQDMFFGKFQNVIRQDVLNELLILTQYKLVILITTGCVSDLGFVANNQNAFYIKHISSNSMEVLKD